MFIILLVLLISMSAYCIYYLRKQYKEKLECGYRFLPTDTQFTFKNCINFSIFTLVGGLLSGFLGVGGGTIYNPMLIEIGKHP